MGSISTSHHSAASTHLFEQSKRLVLLVIAPKLARSQNGSVLQHQLARVKQRDVCGGLVVLLRIVVELLKLFVIFGLESQERADPTVLYAMEVWPLSNICARTAMGLLKPWLHVRQMQPTEIYGQETEGECYLLA